MKLISNLQEIDRKAVSQAGIQAKTLMESAGEQVAKAVQRHCGKEQRGVIVCGPGNNGGDGFVCARKLHEAGYQDLTVVYTGQRYRNESLENLESLMMAVSIPLINAQSQLELAKKQIQSSDFVVDALFGSGLGRPIENLEAELVHAINSARQMKDAWTLAIDIPSGVDGATGQVLGCAVQADMTVTLASPKPGLYLQPGKSCAGSVSLVDIGIPSYLVMEDESPYRLITLSDAKSWLPVRQADSHKYKHGSVLVIAGSLSMPGAAVLCSEAAMSAGAGLVTLAAPRAVFQQLPLLPEIMRLSLPDEEYLSEQSIQFLQDALATQKYNTIVLGPGLGRADTTIQTILNLMTYLKTLNLPVIVDADGLYALSKHELRLSEQFVLTPHVGECVRLLDMESAQVSANLLHAAAQVRTKYGAQAVLKSASTVIASLATNEAEDNNSTQNPTWITPTGNPGMATAGSGDVLTGIIGAMAAQIHAQSSSNTWQAATLGVYLHGLAGDAAAKNLTQYGMSASQITRHLPQAFQQVLSS